MQIKCEINNEHCFILFAIEARKYFNNILSAIAVVWPTIHWDERKNTLKYLVDLVRLNLYHQRLAAHWNRTI